MYFVIAFFTVTFVGALISARTLCGYNDISPWWKVAVFLLLWTVWAMPAVLGGLRTKGWLEGPVYNTLALGGYFLFGFAFLLLMLLLFRDFVWAVSYGLAKLSGHASAGWSPVNTVALTKANLITLALALLLSLYALYEGVKTPRVREIVIETSKTDREIKILQINDMHIDRSKPVKWFAGMVDLANAQKADLIVLPGDIIDDRMEAVLPQAGELKRLKSRYGVYFSPGNHEFYNGLVEIQWYLQKAGFVWLSENGRNVEGLPLYIAGMPDGPRQRTQTQYPHLLRDADPEAYKILLAHNPAKARAYLGQGFDLQLSAHTHGGQIFPFHVPVRLANNFLSGLYELPEGKLYISRGAGYWGPPMRLLAPSDMTLIRLLPAANSLNRGYNKNKQ